jgi:cell division protein FtsX
MDLIAQTETVIIQKAVEEMLKQAPKNDAQFALYVFVVAILVIGCGGFYVLRYMLAHTKEIHETSHKTISALSETFSSECRAARDQHHKDMVMSRDNVHDVRDVAMSAVSLREFNDEIKRKQDARNRPPSGTA